MPVDHGADRQPRMGLLEPEHRVDVVQVLVGAGTVEDLDCSPFVQSTGQSGNLLSALYGNLAKPLSDVEYLPMSIRRKDAEAGAMGTLRLTPR